jgi:hypothetical protein
MSGTSLLVLERICMLRMARVARFAPALAFALGFSLLAAPAQASKAQVFQAQASSRTVTLKIAGDGPEGQQRRRLLAGLGA